ncbi:hypothetical protein Tco_1032246 [Tanacetum coccineum]|uniref:Uncharacterized protein n=1 Tax=Tanacetum coccineum TaxID=301880 RepID=A0ABQ5GCS2_9ASTR
MMMDPFTRKVLCWKKVDNPEGVTNDGFSDLEEVNNEDEQKMAKITRIETNLFDYETSLTKTYDDYKNELNNEVEEPWSENGVPYEIWDHIYEPFCFRKGKTKCPTCNSNEDGFCNGGELLRMVRVGYMAYFQDYEWYDDLTNSSLKEEALKHQTIYEKSCGDATQSVINFCTWLKRSFGNFYELDYELLKEEYVAIKEYEYDDFTRTNEDACHAYQEFFRNMDEG